MRTQPKPHSDGPRLLADIGGTNARFALETAPGQIIDTRVLACAAHATLADAVCAYMSAAAAEGIRHAAIAIANPVDGDAVRMTNHHWAFSIEATRRELGLATLLVENDFKALAMSLPLLAADERVAIGGGTTREGGVIGLVGPGTGLGVAGLVPLVKASGTRWVPLATEGGHVSFAPMDEREAAVLAFARREFAHVSAERLISGPGLVLIQRALRALHGVPEETMLAAEIAHHARERSCAYSVETAEIFSGLLGSFAGNVALTLGAQGGMYLGGGVIGGLGAAFDRARFRARFVAKGRFEDYLQRIATLEITASQPALRGVSALLADHLASA